jgi:2-oxoglutarate dehydrogenase E2 component (dihydrolipoamide succinyltransferase)
MPLMGESITEATLVRWLKKPGDEVKKDEPLLEVSTDKVDTEIPSPATGKILELKVAEGTSVAINSVIAVIGDAKEAVRSGAQSAPTPAPAAKASTTPAKAPAQAPMVTSASAAPSSVTFASPLGRGRVRSSPLVRKMAQEHRIDLGRVPGSGLFGRITRADIEKFIAGGAATSAKEPIDRLQTEKRDGHEFLDGVQVQRQPMTKIRSLIAEHMVRSVRVSPHVTTVFEVDLHKVNKIREENQAEFLAKNQFKLTFTPFFIHAAVQAIKEHPIVNCSVDGTDILMKDDINIGCAVAIEQGLIVPVIKRAQDLSLLETAVRLNDLVTRARTKKLNPDDVKGGTFSITNPGGYGSITSNPIINQPQVAILGIGAVVKRPVVINDEIAIRPMMLISLTFDHRVVDGEGGAKYLQTLKKILENYGQAPV